MSSLRPLGSNPLSRALATIYRAVVSDRNKNFDAQPDRAQALGRPAISIGGISAGGTGKTPLTALICEELISSGCVPVILSRGYGRRSKKVVVVAPGETALWQDTGDEPAMLHRRFPSSWLAIHGNRRRAAAAALPLLPAHAVFILDDAFQRRDVRRDLDIICVHPHVLDDLLIPAGTLREPLENMQRADLVCIIGGRDEIDVMNRTRTALVSRLGHEDIVILVQQAGELRSIVSGLTVSVLPRRALLMSGIARPERFAATATALGIEIAGARIFSDHHRFSSAEIHALIQDADGPLITTEKDAIRVFSLILVPCDFFWYLTITLTFPASADQTLFFQTIHRIIGKDTP